MSLLSKVGQTITVENLLQHGDTIVLGISGGPDSLALAHLLRALSGEWRIRLHLAHLNHQLRGADADADAEFVARLAREWDIPATIEARDVRDHARANKVSVEQAAREMRYAFLAEVARQVSARTVAVAHHADDQVESVLMHLLRGAGMAGLRGMSHMSALDSEIRLIRPLLDVTRAEIEAYCAQHALTPRFDLSNLDTTLFRNRLRLEVLPYLETLNPKLRSVLLHTARALADDYEFLQEQTNEAFARVAREESGGIVFARAAWRELYPALQRGTLREAIQHLRRNLRDIAWAHIEDARLIALERGAGAQATLPGGLRLTVGYDEFVIADAARDLVGSELPQMNVDGLPLSRNGMTRLPQSEWVIALKRMNVDVPPTEITDPWTALLDEEKMVGEILLRRRRAGERFQPAGMGGHSKSLHKFMIDEKIPHAARACLPLLCDAEKILWVPGYRADERARLSDVTTKILQASLYRLPKA